MITKSLIAAATSTAAALTLLVADVAHAHMEKGVYKGTVDGSSDVCAMTVGEESFEGARHPLNERIAITIGNYTYKVGHPAIMDEMARVTGFNHDGFQAVLGVGAGAHSLFVTMSHEKNNEGPTQFVLNQTTWNNQDDEKTTICKDLVYQQ